MQNKLIIVLLFIIAAVIFINYNNIPKLPIVAIANYGPHSSLEETIQGIKQELTQQGFVEDKNIIYDIADVGFDSSLIGQMVTKLKTEKPAVIVAMATPVAQFAKHTVKDIPLVFSVITDPVEAGLLKNQTNDKMTCVSDKQDLNLLLEFAKKLIPNASRVGILYGTSEANDTALVKMLQEAASNVGMQVVAIAIDQARDVPIRVQGFKDKVDFIYVGASGPVQPTLPVIIAEADKMGIPIFNLNEDAVRSNQVLASFGVNYRQVGINTGRVIADSLRGEKLSPPIYPTAKDHQGFISKKQAAKFSIKIPADLTNVVIVE